MEPPREIRPRDLVPEEEVGSPLWGSLASLCSFPGLLAAQNSRRADPDFRRIAHLISNGHPESFRCDSKGLKAERNSVTLSRYTPLRSLLLLITPPQPLWVEPAVGFPLFGGTCDEILFLTATVRSLFTQCKNYPPECCAR